MREGCRIRESLYSSSSIRASSDEPEPDIPPGTALTASVETIDNDRADLMLAVGIVR